MTIYFAKTRMNNDLIKIGFTSNLSSRISNLSVSVPGGVEVVATMRGGPDVEDYLHEKFSAYKEGGEWFRREGELEKFISDILAGKQPIGIFSDEERHLCRVITDAAKDAITTAKKMADELLASEHRGPGDTIEAALYRLQTKYGVPAAFLLRLRHRKVNDILLSNFVCLTKAYEKLEEGRNARAKHEAHVEWNKRNKS